MTRSLYILWSLFMTAGCFSQSHDTMRLEGQLSAWMMGNEDHELPLWAGVRYLPSLQYDHVRGSRLLDLELSVNINANLGLHPFDTLHHDGQVKPYRAWVRYSSRQWELRLGLQKINFGSATMLRPLMWFDQVDPRDPLQLTDGVWGVLGRYYWLNNTNLWLWGLVPSSSLKAWELSTSHPRYPELGGRLQYPLPMGEIGLSYHWRMADSRDNQLGLPVYEKFAENRVGFDMKWDVVVGLWVEGSLTQASKDLGLLTHQSILNAGMDYTIGLGYGLHIVLEHLMISYEKTAFSYDAMIGFSGLSLSYPVNLTDNISSIVYFDWKHQKSYNFLNLSRRFNNLTLYLMAYWNPETYLMPHQQDAAMMFAGKGLQCMLVYNH